MIKIKIDPSVIDRLANQWAHDLAVNVIAKEAKRVASELGERYLREVNEVLYGNGTNQVKGVMNRGTEQAKTEHPTGTVTKRDRLDRTREILISVAKLGTPIEFKPVGVDGLSFRCMNREYFLRLFDAEPTKPEGEDLRLGGATIKPGFKGYARGFAFRPGERAAIKGDGGCVGKIRRIIFDTMMTTYELEHVDGSGCIHRNLFYAEELERACD